MDAIQNSTWRALLSIVWTALHAAGAAHAATSDSHPRAEFVEPGFPFFSSVVDGRRPPAAFPQDNLTPRGLVLRLGGGAWACFDVDLLRLAVLWHNTSPAPVTPVSMSQGSYHAPGVKVSDGQHLLPEPQGEWWLANGLHPGWSAGAQPTLDDPRERGPDPHELGRGPLPTGFGRFHAVRFLDDSVRLDYEVAGRRITDSMRAARRDRDVIVERHFRCERATQPLWLAAGTTAPGSGVTLSLDRGGVRHRVALARRDNGLWLVRVPATSEPVEFTLNISRGSGIDLAGNSLPGAGKVTDPPPPRAARSPPAPRWPEILATRGSLSRAPDAYVVDTIELPLENPWRRQLRLADIDFFGGGRAAAVTFDGDVWMIEGLAGDLETVRWRRFTSGLHEPLSLVAQSDAIVVFDRNGLWRLRDIDANGEADIHELISNAFTQTADTREFATSMERAPDGAFIIAKGGQQSSTSGRHNGTVLRVPPNGTSVGVIGHGLRMPFLGVHPGTGMITASDQQGHYVPATPLHHIADGRFYGFMSLLRPHEAYPAPIADPMTWIPHPVNASGASQVWLAGARMGPLTGALIHLGYYRPELLVVHVNEQGDRCSAAITSLTRDLRFPPLHGAVDPVDGQLYVTGFQIWGTEAPQLSGLARVRYTGHPFTLPRSVVPTREGVLLRFDVALEAAQATNPANFSAERWNYKRTPAYGSPHFRLDGAKGQETMIPSSASLAADAHSVFVALPDMRPAMQMRLAWALNAKDGTTMQHSTYFSAQELPAFDPHTAGFGALVVDLTPRRSATPTATPRTAEAGRRLAELMGCSACHSADGSVLGKVGPSWKGLLGRERALADGSRVVADTAYLEASIRDPAAQIVAGFDRSDTGMPSYEGVLTEDQIAALIEYLKTL